jgi:hypothetical protein
MSLTFHLGLRTIAVMRQWSIPPEGPLSLRIAADARMCEPDYADDQIWELKLGGGEPAAVALETTYGLRARGMRIFPSFMMGSKIATDPAQFASPPIVRSLLPNYLRVDLAPFTDLQVSAEYWVPDSHTVAGRFILKNLSMESMPLRLRLHAVLRPGENPQTMDAITIEGVHVLAGRTGNLAPVVFLGGAAEAEEGIHPAITISDELRPGARKVVLWGHGGFESHQRSFVAARTAAVREWDAEIARLEMVNAGLVEVITGDEDWDIALSLAQKTALSGYVGPTPRLPHASFVLTRIPDRGYSERGDGKDYPLDWEGPTAAHAYVNLSQILPAAPELAKGVLRNFLHAQQADGTIDWKPGLGGQRSDCLSIPLLATLAWKTYTHTEDRAFLSEILPGLHEFLNAWFSIKQDRDEDGIPEWEHILQSAFEEWPTFVPWRAWGLGLEICKAETPDLASYLYRECHSLVRIAEELERPDLVPALQERMQRIVEAVEGSWSEATDSYHHRDRDFHGTVQGKLLGRGRGAFKLEVGKTYDPPARVLVRAQGPEGESQKVKVTLRGKPAQGGRLRVQRLVHADFQWFWERGATTSPGAYATIKNVEIAGLSDDFEVEIWTADYSREDQTLLLPLWAGIPDSRRAKRLVEETILDPLRFWRLHGIPSCSAQDPAYSDGRREGAGAVWMLWNTMIGEALVDHGYLAEAVDLISRLMRAVLASLRKDKGFRESYDPDSEAAFGECGHLLGTAPVHLLLYVLGVRLISPRKVWLRNGNPFPWPVTLRWRGLDLRFEEDRCHVTFPNGQRQIVEGEGLHLVEQPI